jgi:hypothetical protein
MTPTILFIWFLNADGSGMIASYPLPSMAACEEVREAAIAADSGVRTRCVPDAELEDVYQGMLYRQCDRHEPLPSGEGTLHTCKGVRK